MKILQSKKIPDAQNFSIVLKLKTGIRFSNRVIIAGYVHGEKTLEII
jgi:hypothetical protein